MLMNRFIYPLISNNTVKLIICNDVLVFWGFSYKLVRTQHACFIIPYLNLYNKSSNWSGSTLIKNMIFVSSHIIFNFSILHFLSCHHCLQKRWKIIPCCCFSRLIEHMLESWLMSLQKVEELSTTEQTQTCFSTTCYADGVPLDYLFR